MKDNILVEAIEKFGKDVQLIVALEELAELQKEICKGIRYNFNNIDEISDEIADVYIMLEQLQIIFNNNDIVKNRIHFKISRLEQILGIEKLTEVLKNER